MSKRPLPLSIALAALLPGCFLIPNEVETARGDVATQQTQTEKIQEQKAFSHELWTEVLREHNKGGFIDYAALKKDPKKLNNYLALLAKYSPKSHPELFRTEAAELAYWINAYNALAIKNVLRRHDDEFKSVLPVQEEFFYSDRFELGGEFFSLYALEKELILPAYEDPRVHFALNCASYSCPRLPEAAFTGEDLDERLDEEARDFLGEERNVAIDKKSGELILSKLFDPGWYQKDFIEDSDIKAVKEAEGAAAKVVAYINHYRAEDARIPAREGGWSLAYRPYNWRLNARGQESGEPPITGD